MVPKMFRVPCRVGDSWNQFGAVRRILGDSAVTLGKLVSGVVEWVTPHAVVVKLNAKGDMKGKISPEHLAEKRKGHASLLKFVLKPGYKFDQLLVLGFEGR